MMSDRRTALLMSGGIGDYLHYFTRWDDLLHTQEIDPSDIVVFVESTVPPMVDSLFAKALPGIEVRFVPAQIHWTKTHPLLNVNCKYERRNRPASRFVASKGFDRLIDWFLPFCCDHLVASSARLMLLSHPSEGPCLPDNAIVVSLRDKGFLWWPNSEICETINSYADQLGVPVIFLGTPNERPAWLREITTTSDVLTALRMSKAAQLFVGPDTGFSTIRELLGLPNIYCINAYWYKEVLVRYRYLSDDSLAAGKSEIAFDADQCLASLGNFLHRASAAGDPERARRASCPGARAFSAPVAAMNSNTPR